MRTLLRQLIRAGLQIILLLFLYFISRLCFTLINLDHFPDLVTSVFLELAFKGLRFDLSAILSINAIYLLLFFLPLPVWKMPAWQRMLQGLFVVLNGFAFAFELSDWAYFPFTLRRSTNDVLDMISRKGDFIALLPHFIVSYWYVPVGLLIFIVLLWAANRVIVRNTPLLSPLHKKAPLAIRFIQTVALLVVAGLCLIGIRGGLQLIPITNGNALRVAPNQYVPIVLNTPFSIMHSYSGKLDEVHYYSEASLKKFFTPIKLFSEKAFRNKNVVVIILESFSKEYTGLGGRKSFTPFLDSLMQHSFVCTNAFANGLRSAEGIPAILSGIPSLMDEPVTTSAYGTNRFTSLASELKKSGYETAFFHGGTNGTMSFDLYASNAGFDHYVGRTEYGNEKDYDGNWGIWDEPFLQFFANSLNHLKQPFMASVFTLSSHDPFRVPPQYNDLPKGDLPIQQTIAYTDQALRKFFKTASMQPWFDQTLFVITADHAAPVSNDPYYAHPGLGRYAIPIVFYTPDESLAAQRTDTLIQQIDILPSVLDYLYYPRPFFAFGNSIFRPQYPRFMINELSDHYLWYMDHYLLTADELIPSALFNIQRDSMLKHNLLGEKQRLANDTLIPYFKAFIQLYRNAMIQNNLIAE